MKFGLAVSISSNVNNSNVIDIMSKELEYFFSEKNYGSGIKMYTIGVKCVRPEVEHFFKISKPKYVKGKKEIKLHGISITIEDAFSCDIKIDFESFSKANELEAKKILAKEILNSLNVLDGMEMKVKNFDVTKFKSDLKHYFSDKGLI